MRFLKSALRNCNDCGQEGMWPKERRAASRRAFVSFALVLLLGLCTTLAFYTPDRAQTSYCKSRPRTCSDCARLIYFPLATQTAKYSLRRDGERGQFSTSVTACPELRALHSRGGGPRGKGGSAPRCCVPGWVRGAPQPRCHHHPGLVAVLEQPEDFSLRGRIAEIKSDGKSNWGFSSQEEDNL